MSFLKKIRTKSELLVEPVEAEKVVEGQDNLSVKITGNDIDGYNVELYEGKACIKHIEAPRNGSYYRQYKFDTHAKAVKSGTTAINNERIYRAKRAEEARLRVETNKTTVIK